MLSDVVIQKGFSEPAAQRKTDKDTMYALLIESISQITGGRAHTPPLRGQTS